MICCSVTLEILPVSGACKIAPIWFGAGSPMICPAETRSPVFTFERHGVPALCLNGITRRFGSIFPVYSGAGKSYFSTCNFRVSVLMGT